MLWSDPTGLGKHHGTRLRFHLLLVRVDSGDLVAHGSCRGPARHRGGSPGNRGYELGKDRSGSLIARVIRLLCGEVGLCGHDISSAEFFTRLDRGNQLDTNLWHRERSGAGEVYDFW